MPLGLEEDFADTWNRFLGGLEGSHTRLMEVCNEVVRVKNKTAGDHTTKERYNALMESEIQESVWLWTKIWQVKTPKKTKLFMWLVLRNKIPT